MIVRSATPVSFLVQFSSGFPDGDVSWTVLDESGATLYSGTVTPQAQAVSVFVTVAGTYNTLAGGDYIGYRDLLWSYTVGGASITGETRYNLEARVPFGVTVDGVRSKLGADKIDVPDQDISLAAAYLIFKEMVLPVDLDSVSDGGLIDLHTKEAIEALSAIALIPGMKTRIGIKESSGTDTFQRDKVDWMALQGVLYALVATGLYAINPVFDPTVNFGSLFLIASPASDAITGGDATGA